MIMKIVRQTAWKGALLQPPLIPLFFRKSALFKFRTTHIGIPPLLDEIFVFLTCNTFKFVVHLINKFVAKCKWFDAHVAFTQELNHGAIYTKQTKRHFSTRIKYLLK